MIWCRPVYGTGNYPRFLERYANAPEFPFVIPTMLFRPLAFVWRPLVSAVTAVPQLAFGGVVDWIGEGDRERYAQAALKGATQTLQQAVTTTVAGDWSMQEDEYL